MPFWNVACESPTALWASRICQDCQVQWNVIWPPDLLTAPEACVAWRTMVCAVDEVPFGFHYLHSISPPRLFKECLDTGQHIVNHHIRNRLDALGATGLKVNGANLVTQNNPLCLGA